MGANIRLENVCKDYGQTNVIKYVKFEIEDGDFLTILGPSGAGKTTLLKMIAGFEDTSSGSILINGEDIARKPIHKRNIGMLFQNYALFPHMTVNENISFPLGIRKVKKAEKKERVAEMLNKVKLGEYGKRYPRELSGGQQQRVALARALVFNPPVLLLDEPMAALDKQLRKHMQLEIKEIHNALGITTISVTHDQEEALTMATKVCIMKDGMVEQIASPVEIYERPNSVFVAKFIGEANVVECPVVKVEPSYIGIKLYGDNLVRLPQKSKKYTSFNSINVVIRPEKVKVVDDSFNGLRLKAKIEQAVYVGDVLKLKVRLECGKSMKVKVFTQYSLSLNVGDSINLGILEEDMVVVGR
ncbi:putative spermidine/putrescine transport system ATP-binding protein [Ruminiclostridium sufflavum DSM 19573]|uniref:Spermidine/putrescine import ATP-binding protein PotA n=1 Tax=Ruminiclostridium sufflavum DSM 19573 TaxID=1121337 RepID=A0A318XLY1_9FIRM|nr:ABC transporter ATP-binding protein [Ruminiclostridium sufflavum]PYG88737.1 putative spermidine/putrescine transport system ATP-binding protein [Ruminiclostridium sufflavum DSM 19573]